MRLLFLLIFFFPLMANASIAGEVVVGDRVIVHDGFSAELDGTGLFYQGDTLVVSTHDTNGDGLVEYWLVYENDHVVEEVLDTNRDGTADAFITFDLKGEVVEVTGGSSEWEKPETISFTDLITEEGVSESEVSAQTDLVGSLDRITIPRSGLPWITIVLWIGVLGGGYWWYRRKQKAVE